MNLFVCHLTAGKGSICEAAKRCSLQLNLAFKTCSCNRHYKNFMRNADNFKCLRHMQNKLQLADLPCMSIAAASFLLCCFPHSSFITEVLCPGVCACLIWTPAKKSEVHVSQVKPHPECYRSPGPSLPLWCLCPCALWVGLIRNPPSTIPGCSDPPEATVLAASGAPLTQSHVDHEFSPPSKIKEPF